MGQRNQCEFEALGAQGYTGALPNRRHAWNIANGIKNSHQFYDMLIEQGYTGAFPEMERDFWCDGGSTTIRALRG